MKITLICSLILLFALMGSACLEGSESGGASDPDTQTSSDGTGSDTSDDQETPDDLSGSTGYTESSDPAKENEKTDPGTIGKIETIYTGLGEKDCTLIEGSETEVSAEVACPGVAGFKLIVGDYDLRQTVFVVFPDGRKHDLEFNRVVSQSFSNTGEKAEWRVMREGDTVRPIALIVRFNFSVNPADSSKQASYLTVSKITGAGACVTDVVKQVRNQNVKARVLADSSANKPCLKDLR